MMSDCKAHEKVGSPLLFTIKKKADGTEYFEATRAIETGTILFDETPIFQLPFNEKILVCCLSCSTPLRGGDKSGRCSGCGWPICSSQCEQLPIHKDNECSFFSSNKIKYSPEEEKEMDLPLIAAGIRAFTVQNNNLELWEHVQNLGLDTMNKEKKLMNPNHFGRAIIQHLSKCKSKEKEEFEEALETGYKLLDLIRHKGFARLLFEYVIAANFDPVTGQFVNSNAPRYRGNYLFVQARKTTHSCSPNTIWQVGDGPDFKLRLRAAAPIKKGEELTLSRIAHEMDEIVGTIERREYLKEHRGIECKCPRCSSPSEFGSYISAIRCNFCRVQSPKDEQGGKTSGDDDKNSGYFLPVDPLVFDKSGHSILFRCNRCPKETGYSDLLPKINDLSRKLDNFNIESPFFSPSGLKNLIKEYEGVFLHPNHYLLQQAHLMMVEYLRNHTQDLTVGIHGLNPLSPRAAAVCAFEIQDGLQRCDFLQGLVEKITPGVSYAKGRILANKTTLKLQNVHLTSASLFTREELEVQLMQIVEMFAELDQILASYKDDLPSHRGQEYCDQYLWFKSQRDHLEHVRIIRLELVGRG